MTTTDDLESELAVLRSRMAEIERRNWDLEAELEYRRTHPKVKVVVL